jgi:hypothetical protein
LEQPNIDLSRDLQASRAVEEIVEMLVLEECMTLADTEVKLYRAIHC